MKLPRFALPAILLASASSAWADDYYIYVNTNILSSYSASSPGWGLWDESGRPTGYYGSWTSSESIDVDSDGNADYYRILLSFYGVPPGNYSLGIQVADWSWTPYTFWTGIFDIASMNWSDIGYESFGSSNPPMSGNDLVTLHDLDVHGNTFQFGTMANTGSPGMPGLRLEYIPSEARLDSAQSTTVAPGSAFNSSFTWSFPSSYIPRVTTMQLESSGRLALTYPMGNTGTPSIVLNPSIPSITINGSNVMTQATADNRYLMPTGGSQLMLSSGLRLGSNTTLSGVTSFAGGSLAKVYGNSSFAFGTSAQVGAPTGAAQNAVALGSGANASKDFALAIGQNSKAFNTQSIAIGRAAEANATSTALWWSPGDFGPIAIGNQARALGVGATGVGQGVNALGNYALTLGMGATVTAPADGGMAIGLMARTETANGIAIGNSTEALGNCSVSLGVAAFSTAEHSLALGNLTETLSLGQVVVGVAPMLAPASLADWDDMEAEVFVVGAGRPGAVGDPVNWRGYAVQQRTALAVKRGGDVKAAGTVNSEAAGPGKFNRFKAPILIPESGDIGMGEFTTGEQP